LGGSSKDERSLIENARGATGGRQGDLIDATGGDGQRSSKDSKIDMDLPDPTVVVSSERIMSFKKETGDDALAFGVICKAGSAESRFHTLEILQSIESILKFTHTWPVHHHKFRFRQSESTSVFKTKLRLW
jgi:hypothetical protein